MRAVALDLGSKRIGVAVSNSEGTMALPYDTIERSGDWDADHRRVAAVVAEVEAEALVVGLPLSLDGSEGPAVRRTRKELRHLGRAVGVPVETYDERLSTVEAEMSLRAADVGSKRRRQVIDAAAAAVILQGWLDQRHGTDPDAETEVAR